MSTYEDRTWFLAHEQSEPAGPRLIAICRDIAMRQQTLITNSEKCMAIFEYGGAARDIQPGQHMPIEDQLLTFNAAQNVVETVYSKVIKARVDPMPLTTGGGYLQRHRAKQLGKALIGIIEDNDGEVIEEDVVMDALTTDHAAGAVLVSECNDEVKLNHIPIEDVWFDDAETRYRAPRSCYRVPKGGMDKFVACEEYARDGDNYPGLVGTPESRRAAILQAATRPESWRASSSAGSDKSRVDIFEAWHLPSGKVNECDEEYDEEYTDEVDGKEKTRKATRRVKKHDGRHVVCVDGPDGTLIDEPWEGPMFPILLYVPRRRRRSIWGLSIMRDLVAPQREYEKLTMKIQHAHQKMGVSGFVARKQDEISVREITSGTFGSGFVVETNEAPPVPITPEPVASGTYAYAESVARLMAERKGVSTLATASQLPAGLQQASGKALQVFEDFEDVRLLPYHRERERFKVSLSWLIIYAAKRIVDRGVKYRARYRGKFGIEEIDWKDVLIDAEQLVLKVFPVSALSKQPSARFAQLGELLNMQAITVEQFKRLYDLPDLESENELDTSDTDVIDRAMDIMVTTGRYLSPEPFDNLDLIVQRAGKFYNVCRQHEVPDKRLQLLRDYIADAKALKDQIEAEAAAKGLPPAAPMSPPAPPGMSLPEGPLPGMPPAPMPMAS
ncbi:MAG: hypothetical protein ACRCU1_11540 [Alsobacter sp.]